MSDTLERAARSAKHQGDARRGRAEPPHSADGREGTVRPLARVYHLIRLLMAQATSASEVDPRELSFKHTVQLWTEWTARGLSNRATRADADLLKLIARIRVGNRLRRVEPRMRKRRPKSYPWLKITRAQARW